MSNVNSPAYTPWLSAFLTIAKHYRIAASEENIRVNLNWERGASIDDLLHSIARQLGLSMRTSKFTPDLLDPWRLPIVVEFKSGQIAVIEKIDRDGRASVQFSGDNGLTSTLSASDIAQDCKRVLVLRPEQNVSDARVDEYIQPYQSSWFWDIVLSDWKRYWDIMLASLLANILALASMLFSMQVFDRVVPAQSIPTLWVLAGGVGIAFLFEYLLRILRTHLSDLIGKRADLRISDRVFGHALRIKNSQRSKSTGTFISQIRELESVRELVTSTTVGAFADLPFYFLFLFIFAMVGGGLVWIPLSAIPLIFIPGILVQPKLAKLSQEGMRESSIRNALLVEAVQGMDDIKLLRAEPRFQNQWNHMNEVSADISMKQRMIGGLLGSWTQTVQSLMYVLVILAGSYMVMDGTMTTGALVACSILASRMVAPLANLTGLFVRLQQAKVAKKGLDELMQKDVDQSDAANQVQRPVLHGNYQLQGMGFKYNEKDSGYVLAIGDLKIKAGEKIALLGKNGSGKTTLLQLLSGLQYASTGKTMLDGLDMSLIDPSDVRRDVGFLTQQASLFFGSIRENVTLGAPLATDEAILRTLQFVGLQDFVQSRKEGLDSLILEGGIGLSGGQKQALLLARTMIREPNVLLLDEPTAWLDEVSEKRFIDNMREWMGHRTLIIATHRMAVLSLVDRIIVLNDGKLVKDGRKDDILPPTGAPQQPSPALRQQQVSANTGVAAKVEQAKAEQQAVVVATQAAAKAEAPKPQTADVAPKVVEAAVTQPTKPVVVNQAAETALTTPKPVQPTVAPVIPTVAATQAASTPAKPVVLNPETGEPMQPAQKAEADVTTAVVAAKQETVVPSVHPAVVEQMAQAAKRAKTLQTPAVAQPVASHSVETPKLNKQEAVAAKAETAKPAEVAEKTVVTAQPVTEQSVKAESKAQPGSKVVEPAVEKPAATAAQTSVKAATTNKPIAVSEAKPTVSAATTAKPVAPAAPANAVPVKAQSVSNATVAKELAKAQPAVGEPVAKAATQPQPIVSSVTAKAPTQAQSATSADKSKEVAQAVTKTTAAKASTPAQPVSAKTTAQTQPAAVTAVVKQAAQDETKSVVVQAATVQGKPAPVSGIVKQTAETPQAQAVKPVTTPQTQATAEQPAASAGQAVAFPVYALKLALHRAGGKLPDETQPENVAYLQNLRNLQNK